MRRAFAPLAFIVLVVLIIGSGAFYQVSETEQVIITRFGEPVGGPITTPGLKLKMPFIHTVRRFEKRILEWDGSPDQIPTLDKRFILLDTTARWRISDPLRFLQSVGDERSAQSRLDDLIDSAARDVVSSHMLIQAVRTYSRELPEQVREERGGGSQFGTPDSPIVSTAPALSPDVTAALPAPVDVAPEERLGRDKLTALMVTRAQENLPNLGIELIDVRIRRINYVREVEQRVYERMISERQRIAAHFRSEGDGASAKIQGEKERAIDFVRSDAYRRAQEIIGKADAEAARIYAEAYGQDPEFYALYQTLEAYIQTMRDNTNLLLTTESDFYHYLQDVGGSQSGTSTSERAVMSPPVETAPSAEPDAKREDAPNTTPADSSPTPSGTPSQ